MHFTVSWYTVAMTHQNFLKCETTDGFLQNVAILRSNVFDSRFTVSLGIAVLWLPALRVFHIIYDHTKKKRPAEVATF